MSLIVGIALVLIALVYTEADRAWALLIAAVVFLDLAVRRLVYLFDRWPQGPYLPGDPNCPHEWTQGLEGRSCAKCHRREDYNFAQAWRRTFGRDRHMTLQALAERSR